MIEIRKKPLLTFAVVAFNQAAFIREAVQSALAQSYSPLEIVLSDGGSQDETFEIMREAAGVYRGPHTILLNRNEVRSPIGGHINRVVEISKGELIVGQAGDDVSLPQRTQVVYEAWEHSGRRATSIHSDVIQIDEQGRTIEKIYQSAGNGHSSRFAEQKTTPLQYIRTLEPLVLGAAHAFSRRLFQDFGKLPPDVVHEDNVLPFRSILAGGLLFINEALVKYRLHGANLYLSDKGRPLDLKILTLQEERVRRTLASRENMYQAFLLDLELAKSRGLLSQAEAAEAVAEAETRRARLAMMSRFLGASFLNKCRILARLRREGLEAKEARMLRRRLLPTGLLLRIRHARNHLAVALNRN